MAFRAAVDSRAVVAPIRNPRRVSLMVRKLCAGFFIASAAAIVTSALSCPNSEADG